MASRLQNMASRAATPIEQAIQQLCISAANITATDRRYHRRVPFFRSVKIQTGERQLSGFTRDISSAGIGLLHDMALPRRAVDVTLPTAAAHHVDVRTEIKWCRPCGDGWYSSAAKFANLSAIQASMLLLATFATEVERHWKERFPFFQPVTIQVNDSRATTVSAFSRDISMAGIGLLHRVPLETQTVNLTIPTASGASIDVRTRIIWCKPCGDKWFISGGHFVKLCITQLPDFSP